MDNSNYMDVKMVSEYLHVAKATVYKWTSQKTIPYVKLNDKRTLYVKDQIDKWVLSSGAVDIDLPVLPKF